MNGLWRFGRLAICLVLLTSFVAACRQPLPPTPTTLTIFHTNDIHGYAAEERDDDGRLARVGYPRLKTLVDESPATHTLLLDAGDSLHGQPLATARRGEFIARLLPLVGYDALAVGNHDFDYGLARLLELRDTYRPPLVAANVVYTQGGEPVFPPYAIKDFGDFEVGIFGLSTPETPQSTSPANVAPLSFSDGEALAAKARETIRTLKSGEGVDLVVALTHLGTEPFIKHNAQWLAARAPGIDVIIDGHSHSEVEGLVVGNTLIASTGAFFQNVGQIDIAPAPHRPRIQARLWPADQLDGVRPDPEIAASLKRMEKELATEMAVVVGSAPFDLEGRREIIRNNATNLGRLITTAMMRHTGADAALFNSGSIRASIPAGRITRGRLLEVLPFGNYAVTVKLRGSELRQVLEQGLAAGGSGGFLQFSGLEVTADKRVIQGSDGSVSNAYKIRSIRIGGRPLSDRAEYVVAINDFLNEGGDGYDLLKKTPLGQYETVEEMLLKYIAETPADELAQFSPEPR